MVLDEWNRSQNLQTSNVCCGRVSQKGRKQRVIWKRSNAEESQERDMWYERGEKKGKRVENWERRVQRRRIEWSTVERSVERRRAKLDNWRPERWIQRIHSKIARQPALFPPASATPNGTLCFLLLTCCACIHTLPTMLHSPSAHILIFLFCHSYLFPSSASRQSSSRPSLPFG